MWGGGYLIDVGGGYLIDVGGGYLIDVGGSTSKMWEGYLRCGGRLPHRCEGRLPHRCGGRLPHRCRRFYFKDVGGLPQMWGEVTS